MALPNTNLSVAMVRDELGAATNNVGQLCTHLNINKWSKWKPVKHNSLTPITQNQLASTNFGLKPPDPKTDYTLVMDVPWGYQKPTGGSSSPYRLTDFINYDKLAGAIAYVPDKKLHINKSTVTSRDITLLMNTSESDSIIGLGDFIGDIGGYYYGAVIEERTNRFIITSNKTLANGGFSFTLDFTQPPFNLLWPDYTIRHLLISKSSPTIQTLGNFGAASYMSIPTADGEVNFTEMTVSTRPPSDGDLVVNFTHVGTSTLPQYPISNYQSLDGASMQTSGDLYFRVNLVNFSNSSKIFQYPDEIGISPTFFGDTYRGPIEIYYQGVLKTDAQISVPASTTIQLVMGNINLVNRKNYDITPPPINTEIFPLINLYRNSYRIKGTSLKLKS